MALSCPKDNISQHVPSSSVTIFRTYFYTILSESCKSTIAVSCPKDNISQQVPHPQSQYSGPISIILSESMASGFSSCPIQNLMFMVTLAF